MKGTDCCDFPMLAKEFLRRIGIHKGWSIYHVAGNDSSGFKFQKKCFSDEPLVILLDEIQIDEKVRWNSRRGPEFTWEHEDQMKKKYPHLFAKPKPTSNATS
ncbi:hypothetical protein Tco_0695585 [Tanacetum coccineum]